MMDKHAIKEKGKQLIDHLPGWGDIHGAFTWQDRQGKRHQLSVGPKLVTLAALSTAFCAVALAVCAGLLSRAWAEQNSSITGPITGSIRNAWPSLWITMKNFSGNFPKWLNWKRLSEKN